MNMIDLTVIQITSSHLWRSNTYDITLTRFLNALEMIDLYNDVDSSTKLDFFVVYTFIVVINTIIYSYDYGIYISKIW